MPFNLNETASYSGIVPGLPTKFPDGVVSLTLSLGSVPTLDMGPGAISTNWPFNIAFSVTPPGSTTATPAFAFVANSNISVSLAMKTTPSGLVLTGSLNFLNAELVPGPSVVGPESGLPLLQDLVQFLLTELVVPGINNGCAPARKC
jgi:hypothetical protein